jgi:hypothetical protein
MNPIINLGSYNFLTMKISLETQVKSASRHLLSEINRDPSSNTFGCFDRRYWAWKLTDFPEATFQRNVLALTRFLHDKDSALLKSMILEVIKSGLLYALKIQHRDGSFDQAYPNEHSYGATAFLLSDLVSAYVEIKSDCSGSDIQLFEAGLYKAAAFLSRNSEQHSLITNHLAGASLGLFKAGSLFSENQFSASGQTLLDGILVSQSPEGWFPEYGGADPGYQTLCMHYLAQIYKLVPSDVLKKALDTSLDFLTFFVHPDGTFAGEYGSRRTEIYYPGGIALLADEFPKAACLHKFMLASIEMGNTVNLVDVDMGNMAPLLSSSILAINSKSMTETKTILPFQMNHMDEEFPLAGIVIRSNPNYHLILGASNGGVIKIFDKKSGRLVLDDGGVLGVTEKDEKITTQSTNLKNILRLEKGLIECDSNFYVVNNTFPTPLNYLILRLMNLTIMQVHFLNEFVKKIMVNMLVKNRVSMPLIRKRYIKLNSISIEIIDVFSKSGRLRFKSLVQGIKFTAIHMASARYFTPSQSESAKAQILDHEELNFKDILKVERLIDFTNDTK